MRWIIVLGILVLMSLATVISYCSKSYGHEFYDAFCCNTVDCHAQQPGEFVKLTGDGCQVDVPALGIHELVTFDATKLRNTPLDAPQPFHLCIVARTLRCFYRPGAGG